MNNVVVMFVRDCPKQRNISFDSSWPVHYVAAGWATSSAHSVVLYGDTRSVIRRTSVFLAQHVLYGIRSNESLLMSQCSYITPCNKAFIEDTFC